MEAASKLLPRPLLVNGGNNQVCRGGVGRHSQKLGTIIKVFLAIAVAGLMVLDSVVPDGRIGSDALLLWLLLLFVVVVLGSLSNLLRW